MGAKEKRLRQLVQGIGLGASDVAVSTPLLADFSHRLRNAVLQAYRDLGGGEAAPRLRPSKWDIVCDNGVVIEFDE